MRFDRPGDGPAIFTLLESREQKIHATLDCLTDLLIGDRTVRNAGEFAGRLGGGVGLGRRSFLRRVFADDWHRGRWIRGGSSRRCRERGFRQGRRRDRGRCNGRWRNRGWRHRFSRCRWNGCQQFLIDPVLIPPRGRDRLREGRVANLPPCHKSGQFLVLRVRVLEVSRQRQQLGIVVQSDEVLTMLRFPEGGFIRRRFVLPRRDNDQPTDNDEHNSRD